MSYVYSRVILSKLAEPLQNEGMDLTHKTSTFFCPFEGSEYVIIFLKGSQMANNSNMISNWYLAQWDF